MADHLRPYNPDALAEAIEDELRALRGRTHPDHTRTAQAIAIGLRNRGYVHKDDVNTELSLRTKTVLSYVLEVLDNAYDHIPERHGDVLEHVCRAYRRIGEEIFHD